MSGEAQAHLWAIGYNDMERAERVRQAAMKLAETGCLTVLDTAVVIRYADGSVTLDGRPYVDTTKAGSHFSTGILAGLTFAAPPLCEQAVRTILDSVGGAPCDIEIDKGFVCDVQSMITPETSVLFLLDQEGEMGAILEGIRGLGGKVLKSNVDAGRVRQVQSKLAEGVETAKPFDM
jgi:uncharacterized membrane protein